MFNSSEQSEQPLNDREPSSEVLHEEFMSESVVRPDDLDHELLDAIILRASTQVSEILLKQREKDREERRKLRDRWQEERRTFAQNTARCLESTIQTQKRLLDEVTSRLPKPENKPISNLWYVTLEVLKGVGLVSAIWYLWKNSR